MLGAELGLSVQVHPQVGNMLGNILGASLGALDKDGAGESEGAIERLGDWLGELDTEGALLGATD